MPVNAASTYLEMMESKGFSKSDAIRQICEEVGLVFSPSYISGWTTETRTIPPAALRAMQMRVAHYAAAKSGIDTSRDKAVNFAKLLGPSSPKKA